MLSRIVRVIINEEMERMWEGPFVATRVRATSNHVPLLFSSGALIKRKPPFRFHLSWLDNPQLPDLMRKWWQESSPSGYPGYCLWAIQMDMRLQVHKWRNEDKNNWRVKAEELEKKMGQHDNIEEGGDWIEALRLERIICKQKLDETLASLKSDWRQRSRCQWVRQEDRKSKYFQAIVKSR